MEALFLPVDPGYRLCVLHAPADGLPRAVLICIAPFAEEMNKSRRMLALGARAFAEEGCAVVVVDLLGCGDSSGDFGDASWSVWLRDVAAIRQWAARRFDAPQWLWGVRAGALLATRNAVDEGACDLLLWQPVLSGQQHFNQFLRLKIAGDALADESSRESTKEIRERLRAGKHEEIAGYRLAPELAEGIEQATLTLPPGYAGKVVWCDVSGREPASHPPASSACIEQWLNSGLDVRNSVVPGPSFWQTQEITDCPALVEASRAMIVGALQ